MSTNTDNSEAADSADSCQQDDSAKAAKSGSGGGGKKTPGGKVTKPQFCSLASNMMPSFYIGGGNGVSLIEAPLLALGWKRTSDKYDEKFRLKWVECKSKINYAAFKEGDQIVNHISNCQLITNKLGLLNSLQEYERVTLSTKGRLPKLKMAEFVPETYRLDSLTDREAFLQVYKDGEMWICKPTGMNQGKGIYLLRTREEIERLLSERDAKKEQCKPSRPLMSRIVQRYIHNPLLLDERKFDIRAYMLIANTTPYLVLYHKGYVRLSCFKYDGADTDLTTHLTNQFIQKKAPQYSEVKEDTAWSMDKFNKYINEKVAKEKGVEKDWVYNSLTKQMQRIMIHCFNSVKHKLHCKVGYFDLYGFDFMIDQNMRVWLIEININPCLATNCEALKEVIPNMVEETLHIAIECFEKSRKCQPLMPLNSQKTFTVLYCGSNPAAVQPRHSRSVSPERNRPMQQPFQRQGRSPGRGQGVRGATSSTQLITSSPYQTKGLDPVLFQNSQKKTSLAVPTTQSECRLPSINQSSGNSRVGVAGGASSRPVGNSSSAPNKNNTTTATRSGNASLSRSFPGKKYENSVYNAVPSARKSDDAAKRPAAVSARNKQLEKVNSNSQSESKSQVKSAKSVSKDESAAKATEVDEKPQHCVEKKNGEGVGEKSDGDCSSVKSGEHEEKSKNNPSAKVSGKLQNDSGVKSVENAKKTQAESSAKSVEKTEKPKVDSTPKSGKSKTVESGKKSSSDSPHKNEETVKMSKEENSSSKSQDSSSSKTAESADKSQTVKTKDNESGDNLESGTASKSSKSGEKSQNLSRENSKKLQQNQKAKEISSVGDSSAVVKGQNAKTDQVSQEGENKTAMNSEEKKNNATNAVAIEKKMTAVPFSQDTIYTLVQTSNSPPGNIPGPEVKLKMTHVRRKTRESSGN